MNYRLNPNTLGEIFAVPAAVVDEHIKLAGSAQLKVLLWLLRGGQGVFDVERCSKAIGLSPADCCDALQFWIETGILFPARTSQEATMTAPPKKDNTALEKPNEVSMDRKNAVKTPPTKDVPSITARPRAVKPSMKEVISRQKANEEFAYLLDTSSARLGRPITSGDMETLLYLYDTAGLPVEVILMVIEYAIAEGKSHMRYIEKVSLDWADRGFNTIAAAEQHLCALEHRREAWHKLSSVLGLSQSPTLAQSEAAERWIFEWQVNDGLLRIAFEKCAAATGKFNSGYMMKIIEQWRAEGIDSTEKLQSEKSGGNRKGKGKPRKETSFDLVEYGNMVDDFTPVYNKKQ